MPFQVSMYQAIEDLEEREHLLPYLAMKGTFTDETRAAYKAWLLARGDERGRLMEVYDGLAALVAPAARAAALTEIAAIEEQVAQWWIDLVLQSGRNVNCGAPQATAGPRVVRFSFPCAQTWEKLRLTADPTVRACDECRRDVHRAETFEEAERLALLGECINVPARLVGQAHDELCKQMTGRPDPIDKLGQKIFRQSR